MLPLKINQIEHIQSFNDFVLFTVKENIKLTK